MDQEILFVTLMFLFLPSPYAQHFLVHTKQVKKTQFRNLFFLAAESFLFLLSGDLRSKLPLETVLPSETIAPPGTFSASPTFAMSGAVTCGKGFVVCF